MQNKEKRYFLIDGIRGAAIINMVLFHFLYDIFIVYERNPLWYDCMPIHIWQQIICWTFIFISGFVWTWGIKSNLQRGIFFNICGLVISIITVVLIPSEEIWFGILNFMGCAVLLMYPIKRTTDKIPPTLGVVMSFILFILFKNIQNGYIGFGHLVLAVPKVLYSIKILTPIGFPFSGFYSSDFFPLLPWMFLNLCGYFFNKIFESHNKWKKIATHKIPILSLVGKKTIWIYLLHQPISMLICNLIFR